MNKLSIGIFNHVGLARKKGKKKEKLKKIKKKRNAHKKIFILHNLKNDDTYEQTNLFASHMPFQFPIAATNESTVRFFLKTETIDSMSCSEIN